MNIKFKLLVLVVILLVSVSCKTQYSGNPILPDFQADPSARVFNDTCWIYPSHDVAGSKGWDMVDWHTFSSTDLVNWKDHGVIFSLKDITWSKKWAWAPDCIFRNGKYYFYYPADDQIGVAVSDRPNGPFTDPLQKPLIARKEGNTRVMDPNIFIDDDGQAYLYFGNNGLRVVKLKEDMIIRDGEISTLDVKNFHEGVWVFKRKGLYYVTYPSYFNKKANLLEYSVGKTPYGPFEHKGVIIDNNSRNVHHSIVEIKGKWYLFYHIEGPSAYERRVCVENLNFNADGTIKPIVMTKKGVKVIK